MSPRVSLPLYKKEEAWAESYSGVTCGTVARHSLASISPQVPSRFWNSDQREDAFSLYYSELILATSGRQLLEHGLEIQALLAKARLFDAFKTLG